MEKKFAHLITRGVAEPLSAVAFHYDAPITRYVMLKQNAVQGDGGCKVVVHAIGELPETVPPYCDLHQHEFDEVNLILSEGNNLRYRIRFEDEEYEVDAPATVYIPAGVRHAAEVMSGRGTYIALLFTKDYQAKK